jgi:hypothetical protein
MTRIEVKAERKGKDASQLRCVPCPRKQRPARGLWMVEAKPGYSAEFWS